MCCVDRLKPQPKADILGRRAADTVLSVLIQEDDSLEKRGDLQIIFKLMLAAVSGLCWVFLVSEWDPGESKVLGFLQGILPGVFFAAGVLFPYLKRHRFVWLRVLGLIMLSWVSFISAILVGAWVDSKSWSFWHSQNIGAAAYVSASLVGAFIVLIGARFIIPLRHTVVLAIVGLVASIIGGLVFISLISDSMFVLAVMAWHTLMAAAIYVAENWSLLKESSR